MTEEIKLSKFDNEPWGFRLTGGKDFGTVLTVIKISQGSLAEKAGMNVGDLILAINDQPLTNLTHSEAHDAIIQAGNNFVLTIVRGSLVLPPPLLKKDPPTLEINNISEQLYTGGEPLENLVGQFKNSVDEELVNTTNASPWQQQRLSTPSSPVPVIQVTPPPLTGAPEIILMGEGKQNDESQPMTDEELEELMLGHAEVITGNAIGVDFFKMAPQCEVIDRSEVLQAIQDEKINEAKRTISKFLQQPDRPKVKPKQCDPPATPYKPVIIIPKIGQPGPEAKNKTNQQSSEEPSEEEKQEQTIQEEKQDEQTIQEEKQDLQTIQEEQKEEKDQGEQTRPEDQKEQENRVELKQEQIQEEAKWDSDLTDEEQAILQEMAAINTNISDFNKQQQENESPNRSPEFEKQMKKINEQLVNLLCMPLDMQRTLVQVKKQLDELRRLKNPPPEPEPEPEPQPEPSEHGSVAGKTPTPTPGSEGLSGKVSPQDEQFNSEEQQEKPAGDVEEDGVQEVEPEPIEEIGPPKNPRRDIKWQKDPMPKNKPFFPLTPKPRPVALPQDAPVFHDNELFSEDFIAETLSGNAEVIQGKAIGVNFLKFKKNYDHLQSSDVYQLIHNEEKNQPVFPSRSGKIPSKEDCVESVSVGNQ